MRIIALFSFLLASTAFGAVTTTPANTPYGTGGSGTGDLLSTNNLSDVASVPTARTNLGLTALATTTPGSGCDTFLATPTSANLLACLTTKTGTGSDVFGDSPTITTPTLTLKQSANPTPTAEGDIQWDTDDDVLKIGNGSGTDTLAKAGTLTDENLCDYEATGTLIICDTPKPTGTIVGTSDTQTLTNKRVTKRVGTTASSATPTINTDNVDQYSITALAADITSFTTNLSGTPSEGDSLLIWIKDNGSARALTFGASFAASTDLALPTTTTAGKYLYLTFRWNATASKWHLTGKLDNF